MDKFDQIDRIARLLALSRAGALTPEQHAELEHWRVQSPANDRLYTEWCAGDSLADDLSEYLSLRSPHFCEEMKQRIAATQVQPPVRRANTRRRILIGMASAAAVVALLIGFRNIIADGPQQEHTISMYDGQTPVMYLADGREVALAGASVHVSSGVTKVVSGDGHEEIYTPESPSQQQEDVYNRIRVPNGASLDLILDDGTRVWLNAGSELRYPARFGTEERCVHLSGEAYFKVSADAARPFKVVTQTERIEVLGTEFNLSAYPDAGNSYATLVRGSVRVESGGQTAVLSPGDQAIVSGAGITVRQVNATAVGGWHDGMFVLEDKSIGQIMEELSRWYDFSVEYTDMRVKGVVMKGSVPRFEDLDVILDIMRKTGMADFRRDGGMVIVGRPRR